MNGFPLYKNLECGGETILLPAFFKNLAAGRKQTVVLYGTSLTAGGEWARACQRYFETHFPETVLFYNAALAGRHSNWGLAQLPERVLALAPDLVFIEFAVNDASTQHGISVEKSIENLNRMVAMLRQLNPRVEIILQTMNPGWDVPGHEKQYATSRPELERYYAACRDFARKGGLALLDHYPVWCELRKIDEAKFKSWLPDGLHPIPEASLAVTWTAVEALLEKSRIEAAFS